MKRFICFSLMCLAVNVVAQPEMTGNSFVTAIVSEGLIAIRQAPGDNQSPTLTYPAKSFVTFMIGGKAFTNNNVGSNVDTDPRYEDLGLGVTVKFEDTVRTIWMNKNGCSLVQDVYPVQLEASGQIVMRWRLRNNGSAPVKSAVQFLLDLNVGTQTNSGSPLLTKYGYSNSWAKYKADSLNTEVPPFFAIFEKKLPNSPTFERGITGVGYTEDRNYSLGLKPPAMFVRGDWNMPYTFSLVDNLWGTSPNVPWGEVIYDPAVLYQWEEINVAPGQTVELGSTAYGTSEFGICKGQILGLVSYPRRFNWNAPSYSPDTAAVDIYAFNVYSATPQDPTYGPPSANTFMSLLVGPNLSIIEPGPVAKLHKQQTDPFLIPQSGVGVASWKVVADNVTDCTEDLASWIKFTGESSLTGTGPIFDSSGVGDTCEHAVVIECAATGDVAVNSVNDSYFELSINPATDRTIARLYAAKPHATVIRIADLTGRELSVRQLMLASGVNEVSLDVSDLPLGSYYVIVELGGRQYAKKLQIVR